MKKSFLLCVFVMVLAVGFASAASAASVTVSNALGHVVSLAFCYTDTSGGTVTQGWWKVAPGGETTVKLNADSSKPIYYAAFNKNLFADSSTKNAPQTRGPLSYRTFRLSLGDMGDFESRFFKVPDSGAVNIDESW
jgi:hypothetical protein